MKTLIEVDYSTLEKLVSGAVIENLNESDSIEDLLKFLRAKGDTTVSLMTF